MDTKKMEMYEMHPSLNRWIGRKTSQKALSAGLFAFEGNLKRLYFKNL